MNDYSHSQAEEIRQNMPLKRLLKSIFYKEHS